MRWTIALLVVGCVDPTPSETPEPGTTQPPTTPTTPTTPTPPTSDVNSDADCLTDAEETALGTDPLAADTDGDGLDDCAEVACVSDPSDPDEWCYTCGWPHGDPGTIVSTGDEVGDVAADLPLFDQCGEAIRTYDFAGSYVLLFVTTGWCETCIEEAQALDEDIAEVEATTGQPFVPIIALFQDAAAAVPLPGFAATYATTLSLSGFPVTVDQTFGASRTVPYDGALLPGKCLLDPGMEILGCTQGSGTIEPFVAWIEEDLGQ